MLNTQSGVVAVNTDFSQMYSLFYDAIMEKLGEDRPALKALEIKRYEPATPEEAVELEKRGIGVFNVAGALGLNDSGQNWKVFGFQIEEGLTAEQDAEVADQLAHQCLMCVAKMKKEAKKDMAPEVATA
jgi:hypothetical protein